MISLSFASVLVISENSFGCCRRTPRRSRGRRPRARARSWSDSLFSAALTVSASSPTLDAHAGHRLVEQPAPGANGRSPPSRAAASPVRRKAGAGGTRAGRAARAASAPAPGSASFASSTASSSRFSSRVKNSRWLLIAVTRSLIDLVEAADRGVGRIAGEQQLGVGHQAAEDFLDALVLGDRLRPAPRRTCRPACRHRRRRRPSPACLGAVEIGLDRGAVGRRIEVGQVPARQGIRVGLRGAREQARHWTSRALPRAGCVLRSCRLVGAAVKGRARRG